MNGGNAVGIFVSAVSGASKEGLQKMDQLLEANGKDLRHATAEEAITVLQDIISSKKLGSIVVAQFNPASKFVCMIVLLSVTVIVLLLSACLCVSGCSLIVAFRLLGLQCVDNYYLSLLPYIRETIYCIFRQ